MAIQKFADGSQLDTENNVVTDSSGKSFIPSVISADNLKPTVPADFKTPETTAPYDITKLSTEAPKLEMTQPEAQAQDLTTQIQSLNDSLSGKSSYQTEQNRIQGIDEKTRVYNDLAARFKGLQNEALAIPQQMQLGAEGRGITAGGLQPLQTSALRKNAIEALSINSLMETAKGNLTFAQSLADKAVAQRFDPIQAEIDAKTKNLEIILKSPAYTLADKNRAQAQLDNVNKQQAEIDKQKSDMAEILKTAQTALSNGADAVTVENIRKAKTPIDAMTILASSGFATNPIEKKNKELINKKLQADINSIPIDNALKSAQIANLRSETAKRYADIAAENMNPNDTVQLPGLGIVNSNVAAFAQTYASTGKIPSAQELKAAKVTFAQVLDVAKSLPKADGMILDKNTSVSPAQLSSTQIDGISALYDLTKKIDQAKQMFDSFNHGVIMGVKNWLIPSKEAQQYNDLRLEISDLLARARTGAAINTNEERIYNGKLPNTFNKSFFLGASGDTSILDLKNSLEGKLRTNLDANGVVINGYSKIKLDDGKEYVIGSVITNAQGQKGRINADGSITLLE